MRSAKAVRRAVCSIDRRPHDGVERLSFEFRAHSLRRTAESFMSEVDVERFRIAHVLNHRSVTHSTVTATYDRYRYDKGETRRRLESTGQDYCRESLTRARLPETFS
jgi:hypothetical protein